MSTSSGQRRPTVMLLVLLAIAILLDRYLITDLLPWAPGLAGVNPMLVFLDIPVPLPVMIDLPVIGLFFFFYWILLLSYPSRYGGATRQGSRKRLWRLFTGLFAIFLCMVAGGGIFALCSGLMPREVRNGIDSFGIQLDLYTPIPDHELIHLRGGMILLVCLLIGIRIFSRRLRTGGLMEAEMAGGRVPEAGEFSGRGIDPVRIVDPRIGGFQEKGGRSGEWAEKDLLENGRSVGKWAEVSTPEKGGRKWAEVKVPEKARAAAIAVPVVAPSRVNVN